MQDSLPERGSHAQSNLRRRIAKGQTWKPRGDQTYAKIRSKKGRGGEINPWKEEDKAWRGGLIVGDGSIYAAGRKNADGKRLLRPMVSVIMCDRPAIQRAAKLIGVRITASGRTRITGRRLWRVQAIGTRALKVLGLVRPFLTRTRIKQAARAIEKARASGYMTRIEKKELKKLRLLRLVKLEPGSSIRHIRKCTGLDTAYLHRYLDELVREGRVRNVAIRARSQTWNRVFSCRVQDDSTPATQGETPASNTDDA